MVSWRRVARGVARGLGWSVLGFVLLLCVSTPQWGLGGRFEEARQDNARILMSKIDQKVKVFRVTRKRLPADLDQLYRDDDPPLDPWGHAFLYERDLRGGYDVVSLGADGRPGGTGVDVDLRLSDMGP